MPIKEKRKKKEGEKNAGMPKLEHEAGIVTTHRSGHRVFDDGEMIKTLFDEQTNNPIRVEYKVRTFSVPVTDLPAVTALVSEWNRVSAEAYAM